MGDAPKGITKVERINYSLVREALRHRESIIAGKGIKKVCLSTTRRKWKFFTAPGTGVAGEGFGLLGCVLIRFVQNNVDALVIA